MRQKAGRTEGGRALPFFAAVGVMLLLTFYAHGVVLGLALLAAGPFPAVQTAFSLSRKETAAPEKTAPRRPVRPQGRNQMRPLPRRNRLFRRVQALKTISFPCWTMQQSLKTQAG